MTPDEDPSLIEIDGQVATSDEIMAARTRRAAHNPELCAASSVLVPAGRLIRKVQFWSQSLTLANKYEFWGQRRRLAMNRRRAARARTRARSRQATDRQTDPPRPRPPAPRSGGCRRRRFPFS